MSTFSETYHIFMNYTNRYNKFKIENTEQFTWLLVVTFVMKLAVLSLYYHARNPPE